MLSRPRHCLMRLWDQEARTELLAFLVVDQLIGFSRTGTWLRTDHLMELSEIRLSSNRARCDWFERARLSAASRELEQQTRELSIAKDAAGLVELLNLQGGQFLDYRSETVREIHVLSHANLMQRPKP
jgi:hypothetical protein